MLVRQLEEEVVKTRAHAKETNPEIKAHIEGLQMENDHLTREVAILKETTKVFAFDKSNIFLNSQIEIFFISNLSDNRLNYGLLAYMVSLFLVTENTTKKYNFI